MFGAAPQGGELKPITPETLFCFYSASKAVMASSVWALLEEGKLALDEVVAEIIPEFGGRGKDDITVLQLLTFTSGFPNAPMHPRLWEGPRSQAGAHHGLAPVVGAGHPLRVPPHLSALGAG